MASETGHLRLLEVGDREVLLVDLVHHSQHLARGLLVLLGIGGEVERRERLTLFTDVTKSAAHAQRLSKKLHRADQLLACDVLRQKLQILVRRVGE